METHGYTHMHKDTQTQLKTCGYMHTHIYTCTHIYAPPKACGHVHKCSETCEHTHTLGKRRHLHSYSKMHGYTYIHEKYVGMHMHI